MTEIRNENRRGSGSAVASELIRPGIELWKQFKWDFTVKNIRLFGWGALIIVVSALLSMVTAGVLTRMMDNVPAYVLSCVLHCVLAISAHLLFVGIVLGKKIEKIVGGTFFTIMVGTMIWLAITRAGIMIDEGCPASSAWAMSFFLFLLETTVPVVMGYILGVLDLSRRAADEELKYHQGLKALLESSDPRRVWPDAIGRLEDDIEELEEKLKTARPEEARELREEVEHLNRRLKTVKEWDPTHSYQRRAKSAPTAVPVEAPVPVVTMKAHGEHLVPPASERNGSKTRW